MPHSPKDAQAMLLAAGLGTRLWPLTLDRAKPAVPFLGRPLVVGMLDNLRAAGVEEITVNTHHLPESVTRALRAHSGSAFPKISHEVEILGTAGALSKAVHEGLLHPDRTTLIANAKLETNIDYGAVLKAHAASGCAASMVLIENSAREAFREVYVEDDRVVGFGASREPETERPWLFTGVHVIEPEVLATIPLTECDTVRDIYPPLIESRRMGAILLENIRWWEFSTTERYVSLHRRARSEGVTDASVFASEGAEVVGESQLDNVILWEGAQVGAGCRLEDVVLGADVALPENTVLSSAVVVRGELSSETRDGRRFGDLLVVPLSARAGA